MYPIRRRMKKNSSTLTLYPSKIKTFLFLIVSIALTAIGVGMVNHNEHMAWLVLLLSFMSAIAFAITLLPNSSYLHISDQGFEMRSLYRSGFIKWDEVEQFESKYIGIKKMVTFCYSQKYPKFKIVRNMVKTITNTEGALPDTYGKSAEELAKLLNDNRNQYIAYNQTNDE